MRARAKRTRSVMAVTRPIWLRSWAKAATSPIQLGVEGCDAGVVWTMTVECVILAGCPPCEKRFVFSFSFRRHLFSWLRQSLDQLCKLVAHPVGLGERREERQRLRVKSLPLLNEQSASGFSRAPPSNAEIS